MTQAGSERRNQSAKITLFQTTDIIQVGPSPLVWCSAIVGETPDRGVVKRAEYDFSTLEEGHFGTLV